MFCDSVPTAETVPAGFDSTISAGELPQTYDLDDAGTEIDTPLIKPTKFTVLIGTNIKLLAPEFF
jgi:hypothetical protein